MLFSTPMFLFLFLPVVLGVYALLPQRGLRNLWLLIASLVFYAWGEQWIVLAMLASIALNFAMGLAVSRAATPARAKVAIGVAVAGNLGLLVVYKYADFVVENVNAALGAVGVGALPMPHVSLPIGISFFTFQAMSYVIDVYRKDASPQRNPIHFALYISMFPQLVAGPIVRYRDIAAQLLDRAVSLDGFAYGVRRFIVGLGKKMLVADTVARASDAIFAVPPDQVTGSMAWLAVACYSVQIYFDFSGYSDMAIGLGHMFGFRFLENFNYPYISRSITEFWRRWHISLSTWFRDYLYIPLGGNRGNALETYRNLLLVFFLCGLWHGASWSFVVWGMFHGAFLVIERVGLARWLERRSPLLRHAYVLLAVLVGWVFFRTESVGSALTVLRAMAGLGHAAGTEYHVGLYVDVTIVAALAAGVIGSVPWLPAFARWRDAALPGRGALRAALDGTLEAATACALLLVLVGCAMNMAAGTHSPFIYFRF